MPEFKPDWCLPPGEILAEEMKARGVSIVSVCKGAPFTVGMFERILAAEAPVTAAVAAWLEQLWGTPAGFWLRLETLWQEHRDAAAEVGDA